MWIAFGLGLLFWTAGDLYWTLAYTDVAKTPYPSLADAGYLAALPCFYVGIAFLIKRRIGHFTAASWLTERSAGSPRRRSEPRSWRRRWSASRRATRPRCSRNLAYPLGDVLLVSFILGALVVSGFRGAGAFLAIIAGLITWTAADGLYLYQDAVSGYNGGWLDEAWLVGPLLIASGVAFSLTHQSRRRVYTSQMTFPALFAAIAVGVLLWDDFSPQHEISVWLAAATLAAVVFRMAISFRENSALLAALDDDASTDSLTELGNRRKLMIDLEAAIRATPRGRRPTSLRDLRPGRVQAVQRHLRDIRPVTASCAGWARSLAAAFEADGSAYRLGGDEFCILVPTRDRQLESIVEAGRAALTEQGEGFRVSASAGAVVLAADATVASEALRLADRRLYTDKNTRSGRVDRQSHELLLALLREREPELDRSSRRRLAAGSRGGPRAGIRRRGD